jgi:hypothetical protein
MPRGSPKGSKSKPKILKELSLNIKKIKREIKDLKAKKLLLPSGNEERINLGRELKALKQLLKDQKEIKVEKLTEINTIDPIKEELIAEILKRDTLFSKLDIDLHKFTVEELQKHIALRNKKGWD